MCHPYLCRIHRYGINKTFCILAINFIRSSDVVIAMSDINLHCIDALVLLIAVQVQKVNQE